MSAPHPTAYRDPLASLPASLPPLSDERQPDGKSLVNPPRPDAALSPWYASYPEELDESNNAFDVHVYYNEGAQTDHARRLHERIRREFPELRVYRFWDKPVGCVKSEPRLGPAWAQRVADDELDAQTAPSAHVRGQRASRADFEPARAASRGPMLRGLTPWLARSIRTDLHTRAVRRPVWLSRCVPRRPLVRSHLLPVEAAPADSRPLALVAASCELLLRTLTSALRSGGTLA